MYAYVQIYLCFDSIEINVIRGVTYLFYLKIKIKPSLLSEILLLLNPTTVHMHQRTRYKQRLPLHSYIFQLGNIHLLNIFHCQIETKKLPKKTLTTNY